MSRYFTTRPRYFTTRLFVFLVKLQGQYAVRRALAEATSKVHATALR